jgi:hypothetical protein
MVAQLPAGDMFKVYERLGGAAVVLQVLQAAFGLNDLVGVVGVGCRKFNKEPAEVWAAVWVCEEDLQRVGLFGFFQRKARRSSNK